MVQILIADDSAAELDALVYLIGKYEFPAAIRTAGNGEKALKLLEEAPCDLLITDIKMPFVDGLELAGRAKAMHPGLRTVIISAYEEFSYAKQAISIGVQEYLLKPIDPRELQRVLERILPEIEAEQEKEAAREAQVFLPQDMDSKIREVCRYINENYGQELSLDILAAKVYLNRDYLSRLFKKETGSNIVQYIRKVRMEKAKELLKETSLKVSAIAGIVGYPNSSYFVRAFCEYAGETPERYRERGGAV